MKPVMRSVVAAAVLALCATLATAQFGGGGFGRGGGYGGGNYGGNEGGGGGGQRELLPSVMHSTLINTTCVQKMRASFVHQIMSQVDDHICADAHRRMGTFFQLLQIAALTCGFCMLHSVKRDP